MSSSRRYPALALGLALGLHAFFALAVFVFSPRQESSRSEQSRATTAAFSMSLVSLERKPPAKRGPQPPEWIHEPFDPIVSVGKVGPGIPVSLPAVPVSGGSADGKGMAPADGSAGGSKSTSPSLLASPDSARQIVFVLDRSISMGHTGALARAKQEILLAIRSLPPDARFHVLVYNRVAELLIPGDWLGTSPETFRAIEGRFAELTAAGPTQHVPALKKALQLRPDLVFLLTDADDLNPADVHAVTRANVSRATIHVVELTTSKLEAEDSLLGSLARTNGGSHRRVAPE